MNKTSQLALRQELEAQTIDFWYEVDINGGVRAASYYVEDAIFETSVREYHGRAAIEAFYVKRRARTQPRISLHLVNNFRIEIDSDTRVRCIYILSLFATDGVQSCRPSPQSCWRWWKKWC